MRMLKMSGFALAAALVGCQAHTADAPPPASSPDVSNPPPIATDAQPVPAQPMTSQPMPNQPGAPMTADNGMPPPMANGPAMASGDDEEAAASLREHHRHHNHGGVTAFVALSLDSLGIDEGQRMQIEKIQTDLRAAMAPSRDAERSLTRSLADGIARGAVDTAAVDASIDRISEAARGVHMASVASLNQLHAVLTPQQRLALVDKVQAHWAVWRRVNHEMEPGGREKEGRLASLTAELNLKPDQVETIAANLHGSKMKQRKFETAEIEAHVQAFSDAFVSESFDASKLPMGGAANAHLAARGAERMVAFYEVVTPVLTPEQRMALAEDLREHTNYPMNRPTVHASNQ